MSLQEKIRTISYSMIDLIDSSTEEELLFKSAPDSWSILECIEHICLVNQNVAHILEIPPPPETENKQSEIHSEGKLHHLLVTKRDVKRISPDIVTPKGILTTAEQAKAMIYHNTEGILHSLENIAISSHTHTIPHHALGEMTKTDWVHFMIAHTQRHIHQIEDIKNSYNLAR